MKKIFWVVLMLLLATPVWGQITIPNVFVPGTIADADAVNENFRTLGQQALNAAGGRITGTIEVDNGVTIDGVDISELLGGNSIHIGSGIIIGPNPPQLIIGYDPEHALEISVDAAGNVTIDATAPGASINIPDLVKFGPIEATSITLGDLICTGCVGQQELLDMPGVGGSYGTSTKVPTFTVDQDGRLTAAGSVDIAFPAPPVIPPSYTTGPNQIPENAIIDQEILARMHTNDTITGLWTFNQAVIMTGSRGNSFTHWTAAQDRVLADFNGATNIARILPVNGGELQIGGPTPAESIIFQRLGTNVHISVAGANGTTGFSQNNAGGLIMEWWGDKSTRFWGDVLPSHDSLRTLGSVSQRWKNINLDLPNNTVPAFVVVNKGGAGTDKNSALGYIIGYAPVSEQIKMMGSCRVSIRGGIITNVELC